MTSLTRGKGAIILSIVLSVVVALSGCAVKAEFNQTFLPESQDPATKETKPKISIKLENDIADRISQWLKNSYAVYRSSPKITWMGGDNIILSMKEYGTYLITPSSSAVRKLEGAEEESIVKALSDRVFFESKEKKAGVIGKALLSAVVGIESNFNWGGTIKDGSHEIEISAAQKCTERGSYGFCHKERLKYTLHSKATGKKAVHVWDMYDAYDTRNLLPFRTWVSPDGNNFMIFEALIIPSDHKNGKNPKVIPLIKNYEYIYADMAVNSEWNKIALLKPVEVDKEKRGERKFGFYDFFVEVYDFKM